MDETNLLESNVLGLLAECLTRHVQSILADKTRLLLVARDAAVLQQKISISIFLPFLRVDNTLFFFALGVVGGRTHQPREPLPYVRGRE